eukprot:2350281-Rhodomonas_salina.1
MAAHLPDIAQHARQQYDNTVGEEYHHTAVPQHSCRQQCATVQQYKNTAVQQHSTKKCTTAVVPEEGEVRLVRSEGEHDQVCVVAVDAMPLIRRPPWHHNALMPLIRRSPHSTTPRHCHRRSSLP